MTGVQTCALPISQSRAQTCVLCMGRWILNHCTTREVPKMWLNSSVVKHLKSYLAIRLVAFGAWSRGVCAAGRWVTVSQPRGPHSSRLLLPHPRRPGEWKMAPKSPPSSGPSAKGCAEPRATQSPSAHSTGIYLSPSAGPPQEGLGEKNKIGRASCRERVSSPV